MTLILPRLLQYPPVHDTDASKQFLNPLSVLPLPAQRRHILTKGVSKKVSSKNCFPVKASRVRRTYSKEVQCGTPLHYLPRGGSTQREPLVCLAERSSLGGTAENEEGSTAVDGDSTGEVKPIKKVRRKALPRSLLEATGKGLTEKKARRTPRSNAKLAGKSLDDAIASRFSSDRDENVGGLLDTANGDIDTKATRADKVAKKGQAQSVDDATSAASTVAVEALERFATLRMEAEREGGRLDEGQAKSSIDATSANNATSSASSAAAEALERFSAWQMETNQGEKVLGDGDPKYESISGEGWGSDLPLRPQYTSFIDPISGEASPVFGNRGQVPQLWGGGSERIVEKGGGSGVNMKENGNATGSLPEGRIRLNPLEAGQDDEGGGAGVQKPEMGNDVVRIGKMDSMREGETFEGLTESSAQGEGVVEVAPPPKRRGRPRKDAPLSATKKKVAAGTDEDAEKGDSVADGEGVKRPTGAKRGRKKNAVLFEEEGDDEYVEYEEVVWEEVEGENGEEGMLRGRVQVTRGKRSRPLARGGVKKAVRSEIDEDERLLLGEVDEDEVAGSDDDDEGGWFDEGAVLTKARAAKARGNIGSRRSRGRKSSAISREEAMSRGAGDLDYDVHKVSRESEEEKEAGFVRSGEFRGTSRGSIGGNDEQDEEEDEDREERGTGGVKGLPKMKQTRGREIDEESDDEADVFKEDEEEEEEEFEEPWNELDDREEEEEGEEEEEEVEEEEDIEEWLKKQRFTVKGPEEVWVKDKWEEEEEEEEEEEDDDDEGASADGAATEKVIGGAELLANGNGSIPGGSPGDGSKSPPTLAELRERAAAAEPPPPVRPSRWMEIPKSDGLLPGIRETNKLLRQMWLERGARGEPFVKQEAQEMAEGEAASTNGRPVGLTNEELLPHHKKVKDEEKPWSSWQKPAAIAEAALATAAAEMGQIRLFGKTPTLTETMLFRARKEVLRDERLAMEDELHVLLGDMGYYQQWVEAWKEDVSREAVAKREEEEGISEYDQIVEMLKVQTKAEYQHMVSTDTRIRRDPLSYRMTTEQIKKVWGGDPVVPAAKHYQDPNYRADYCGPNFHEPTEEPFDAVIQSGRAITSEDLEALLAKEREQDLLDREEEEEDEEGAGGEALDISEEAVGDEEDGDDEDDEEEEDEEEEEEEEEQEGEGMAQPPVALLGEDEEVEDEEEEDEEEEDELLKEMKMEAERFERLNNRTAPSTSTRLLGDGGRAEVSPDTGVWEGVKRAAPQGEDKRRETRPEEAFPDDYEEEDPEADDWFAQFKNRLNASPGPMGEAGPRGTALGVRGANGARLEPGVGLEDEEDEVEEVAIVGVDEGDDGFVRDDGGRSLGSGGGGRGAEGTTRHSGEGGSGRGKGKGRGR
eukprot:TRINITY_DN2340_c0_g1_i1.p1 TRINITY_DN2340_c0_g1~~TRINITY_DN2340_c0_g1_i1.p1  ORF type:complete len:1379 (+),score=423.86 TRINITY_DN2340_c0_g1_i1:215-4351(+)